MSAHLDLEDVAAGHPKAQDELRELYARIDAAEQMAQALDALIGLAVLCQQCPDSWRQNVNAARSARAAWEATK